MARCRIVVDEPGARSSSGDIATPLEAGSISPAHHDLSTLGETLLLAQDTSAEVAPWCGPTDGASKKVDCTLFKSVGVAVQDIATAAAVVNQATELRLGSKVAL